MTATLVIGGTGAMGGHVVERLLHAGDGDVVVLTRDPTSERARALEAGGDGRLRCVRGDVNDVASVEEALRSVDRVFCNTDFFGGARAGASAIGEVEQGLAILEAARSARVDRFVWSSLDNAVVLTDGRVAAPHYDSKAAVTAKIGLLRSEEFLRHEPDGWYTEHVSSLTTSPYFENFPDRLSPQPETLPDGRDGVVFTLPLGRGRYPLIALADIGWFAVHMLEDWQSWGGRDLAVIGDAPTGEEIATTFERVTGIPAVYRDLPLAVVAGGSELGHDFAGMFAFFQAYDVADRARDMGLLRRMHPELLDFEAWLRRTGWRG